MLRVDCGQEIKLLKLLSNLVVFCVDRSDLRNSGSFSGFLFGTKQNKKNKIKELAFVLLIA